MQSDDLQERVALDFTTNDNYHCDFFIYQLGRLYVKYARCNPENYGRRTWPIEYIKHGLMKNAAYENATQEVSEKINSVLGQICCGRALTLSGNSTKNCQRELELRAVEEAPPVVETPSSSYSEVAEFWRENCGWDFSMLVAKMSRDQAGVVKEDLAEFYFQLFEALFSETYECLRDENFAEQPRATYLKGLAGYDVHCTGPTGTLILVQYVPGTFWLNEADAAGNKHQLALLTGKTSVNAVTAMRKYLTRFAEDGPLSIYAATEWIYGLSAYRDQVMFSRISIEDKKAFQVLNRLNLQFNVLPDSPSNWMPFWTPILSEEGYATFQMLVNKIDDMLAAVPGSW